MQAKENIDLSIWQIIKNTFKSIYSNKISYLNIVVILQFVNSTITIFIISILFSIARDAVNLSNIDIKNFSVFLKNPKSIILLILIFIVIAFSTYIDFSFLTLGTIANQKNIKISVLDIIKNAFLKFKNLFNTQLFFLVGYFILMIPVANLGLNSIISKKIYIPNFIKNELLKSPLTAIVYFLIIVIFIYINIRLIFVLPLLLTNDFNVTKSIKKSFKLTRKNILKPIVAIIIMQTLVTVIFLMLLSFLYIGIIFVETYAQNIAIISSGILIGLFGIILLLYISIGKIIITQVLVHILDKNNLISIPYKFDNNKNSHIKNKIVLTGYIIIAITFGIFSSSFLFFYQYIDDFTTIIAHRGYTKYGVENSIEALIAAKKYGSDYVEIDILETFDHKYVVIHDNNLKRLANKDINVSDSKFDTIYGTEIKQGDFVSKISSLDDFIIEAKKIDVKLLVELKLHGNESNDYIDILYETLKKHNVLNTFLVQSLDLNTVNKISEKYPEMNIGFIMPLSFGFDEKINANFLAVEEFSYRNELIEYARLYNMPVYIWTVNDADAIQKRIFERVDGIISDELELIEVTKKELKNSKKISEKLLYLFSFVL